MRTMLDPIILGLLFVGCSSLPTPLPTPTTTPPPLTPPLRQMSAFPEGACALVDTAYTSHQVWTAAIAHCGADTACRERVSPGYRLATIHLIRMWKSDSCGCRQPYPDGFTERLRAMGAGLGLISAELPTRCE